MDGYGLLFLFILFILSGPVHTLMFSKNTPVSRTFELTRALDKLQFFLDKNELHARMREPVGVLERQARQLLQLEASWTEDDQDLAKSVYNMSCQLMHLKLYQKPARKDVVANLVYEKLVALNELLRQRMEKTPALTEQKKESGQDAPQTQDSDSIAAIARYKGSAQQLLRKKKALPQELRQHLDGIQQATMRILECMETDPADRELGDKFLTRYLPAAHNVVDEHIRLARDGAGHKSVKKTLARTAEVLARLEQAFIDEHESLLQNDLMNFTAELNVIDNMLKMQGK